MNAVALAEGKMIFEVYAKGVLIGHSALEKGDPPMGVAFGRFVACRSYEDVRLECRATYGDQARLELSVRTSTGDLLTCAGVAIQDCSDETEDLTDVEVTVLGVEHPPYEELFPEHVAAYERQFNKG
jgi:hypothetical protein